MLLNRLVQVVFLSTCFSFTIPTWASADSVEKTATADKKTSPTNNHFPDVDRDKKHRYPEPEFKPQPHQKSTQDYPEPQIKPQLQQKSTQNYPEPQM